MTELLCELSGCGPPAYASCSLLQIPSSLLKPADTAAERANAGNDGIRIEQDASSKLTEAAPDSIAYVMYTSGSTGTPQAVLGTSAGDPLFVGTMIKGSGNRHI